MANQRIRDAARIANVPQWKIAKEFGLSEEYFCKKLRFEFSREEEKKALRIIERIGGEKNGPN